MIISDDVLAAAERLARCEANYSRSMSQPRDRTESASVSSAPNVPTQEALIAEYERSAELQHEFMTFDAYAAFRRAEARGAFRLLRRVA